jgi:uncharacterized protein (TIGR00255 family)
LTGCAALTHEAEPATIAVTVRAVNHRFLDLQLRVPHAFGDVESRLRALLQKRLARGRVEVGISVQVRELSTPNVELNLDVVQALSAAMDRAREQGLVTGSLTPGDLMRLPQAIAVRERSVDADPALEARIATSIEAAVEQALADLDAMRVREGAHLAADLDARRLTLGELIERLRVAADEGRAALEARLRERIDELKLELPIDSAMIAQEIVRAAARSDITEEITRFRAHLAHWRVMTEADEPCGRKLDFLLQEMNREINTIGSKADGIHISELIINSKAELERMREQVQNVE